MFIRLHGVFSYGSVDVDGDDVGEVLDAYAAASQLASEPGALRRQSVAAGTRRIERVARLDDIDQRLDELARLDEIDQRLDELTRATLSIRRDLDLVNTVHLSERLATLEGAAPVLSAEQSQEILALLRSHGQYIADLRQITGLRALAPRDIDDEFLA